MTPTALATNREVTVEAPRPSAPAFDLQVEGIAFWAPTLPGWPLARAAFRGEGGPQEPPARRPAPALLPPAERRRAPDTVALALEVASAAVTDSGREAASLPAVFVSAHGDLAINDHLCSMLVATPTLISPTKFHNSVHNAAAGYWTIAVGSHAASTALTAFEFSFANGLLNAASIAVADGSPVLLVGYDVPAVGALTSVTRSEGLLAVALVLAPVSLVLAPVSPVAPVAQPAASIGGAAAEAHRAGRPRISLALTSRPAPDPQPAAAAAARIDLHTPAAQALAGNALADALPLFEALARGGPQSILLPLSAHQALAITLDAA